MTNIPTPKAVPYPNEKQNKFLRAFFPVIVKDRTKKYTVLNTRVVRNKHKMKSYNFVNKIPFFTTSVVFVILSLYRLYTSLYKLMR